MNRDQWNFAYHPQSTSTNPANLFTLKINERTGKKKTKNKPPIYKTKVMRKSSSKLIRGINQKIHVVKNRIDVGKSLSSSVLLHMFTPVVNSSIPVSRSIITRYIKPKVIDLNSEKRRNIPCRFHNKKGTDFHKKEVKNTVIADSLFNLKFPLRRKNDAKAATRPSTNVTPKTTPDIRRPALAHSENHYSMLKDLKFAEELNSKRNNNFQKMISEIKTSELDYKYNNSSKSSTLEKTSIASKKIKKYKLAEVYIEGISRSFSFVYRTKYLKDLNPQLLDILPSMIIDGIGKENKHKTKTTEENGNIFEENQAEYKLVKTQRVENFVSKIPELDRNIRKKNKNFTLSHHNLRNRSVCDIDNLLGKTHVILEENIETEKSNESNYLKDQTETASRVNLNDLLEVNLENEELPMLTSVDKDDEKDIIKVVKKSTFTLLNHKMSQKSFHVIEKTIIDAESPEELSSKVSLLQKLSAQEKRCDENENSDIEKLLRDLLEEETSNDNVLNKELKVPPKYPCRCNFTISQDGSKNNSSAYETCQTHVSEDKHNLHRSSGNAKEDSEGSTKIGGVTTKQDEEKSKSNTVQRISDHSVLEKTFPESNEIIDSSTKAIKISGMNDSGSGSPKIESFDLTTSYIDDDLVEQLYEVRDFKCHSRSGDNVSLHHIASKISSFHETVASSSELLHNEREINLFKTWRQTRSETRKKHIRHNQARLSSRRRKWKSVPSILGLTISETFGMPQDTSDSMSTEMYWKKILTETEKTQSHRSEKFEALASNSTTISGVSMASSDLLGDRITDMAKKLREVKRASSEDISLKDILELLTENERDYVFDRVSNGKPDGYKEKQLSFTSPENIRNLNTKSSKLCRMSENSKRQLTLRKPDMELCSSTLNYLKSSTYSFEISKESFPDEGEMKYSDLLDTQLF
ncbi:hypothetical protein HHI36_017497 [Cryptolaemus montrouzieri]|uniref:Uncharacterized protein n=1 Tax=Cryptolaemus montrouzieri TaxID=559131 RepID=A0ABD2NMQ0_9CUCU